jgi:hypothetical protein
MVPLSIRFHDDKDELIFPDIEEGQGYEAHVSEVVVVANGVEGADGITRPSVVLRIELPDGKVGVAMTTARLFCTFADMIKAKHPKAFEAP